MKKILLYHPKTYHEENYKFFWVPYSVLAIASHLTERKYDVKIIDNNTDMLKHELCDVEEVIANTSVIGISCFIGKQILDGLEFAKKAKCINPYLKIIWGGYAPTLLSDLFLNNQYVDYIVKGPDEEEFCSIVENITDGMKKKDLSTKKGFNINNRPAYPYHLINVEEYINDDPAIAQRTINYVSSQGCPFSCGFCSDVSMYHSKQHSLHRERIISDISYMVNQYAVDGIKFYDSNFFAQKSRVFNFIDDLKQNEIKLKWAASAHPLNILHLTDQELQEISNSGCTRILIGAESGCQKVLDMIHKCITVEQILTIATKLSKYDIIGSFTFVIGFPGEPEDAMEKTMEIGRKIMEIDSRFEAKIHFYLPYPGTPMFDKAITFGFTPPATLEEWARYDYYQIEMPWVDRTNYEVIKRFNTEYCPYVSDS